MIFTPKANKGHQIVRVSCTTSSLGKKNALPFEFLALRSAPLNRSKATDHFFHYVRVELILHSLFSKK